MSRKNYCISLVILTCAIVILVFGESIRFPFVQDDWAFITFEYDPIWPTLKGILGFNYLFYRPVAQIYLLAVFKFFGANPVVFHILALCIHSVNAMLVSLLIKGIFKRRLLALVVGCIYAGAVAIHVDTLSWIAGIYDLSGTFFFLLAFLFYINHKIKSSVLFYFLGCLCKEAVVVLPAIIFCYHFYITEKITVGTYLNRRFLKQHLGFVVVLMAYVGIRWAVASPLSLPADHPYVYHILDMQVIKNIELYLVWMLQAICPLLPDSGSAQIWSHSVLMALVVMLMYSIRKYYQGGVETRSAKGFIFLSGWLLFGILPVVFLSNHTFRYYATYSLPAYIVIILLLLERCCLLIRANINIMLLSVLGLSALTSMYVSHRAYQERLEPKSLVDGSNMLIFKANFVNLLHDYLLENYPTFDRGFTLIIARVDTSAIGMGIAPQIWYGDTTLNTYDFSQLTLKDDHFFVNENNSLISVDERKMLIIQLLNGALQVVEPEMAKAYIRALP